MEELRGEAEDGSARLEEIFLKLTGGDDMAEVARGLREALER